jgi:hypothetical protein
MRVVKRSLLSNFRCHLPGSKSKYVNRPVESSIVTKLPPEIWDLVASQLPVHDAAALKASGSFLHKVIRNKHWLALDKPENRVARLKFSQYVDKWFPDHVLCFSCAIFHPKGEVVFDSDIFNCPGYAPASRWFHCDEDALHANTTCWQTRMHWRLVQLVMRSSRLTPQHGFPLDILCHTEFEEHRALTINPKIKEGRLLVKAKVHHPIETFARSTTFDGMNSFIEPPRCRHVGSMSSIQRECFIAIKGLPVKNAANAANSSLYEYRSDLYRCPQCPSEYRVTIEHSSLIDKRVWKNFKWGGTGRYVLTVTHYIDFGSCESPQSTEYAALCNEALLQRDFAFSIGSLGPISLRFGDLDDENVTDKDIRRVVYLSDPRRSARAFLDQST